MEEVGQWGCGLGGPYLALAPLQSCSLAFWPPWCELLCFMTCSLPCWTKTPKILDQKNLSSLRLFLSVILVSTIRKQQTHLFSPVRYLPNVTLNFVVLSLGWEKHLFKVEKLKAHEEEVWKNRLKVKVVGEIECIFPKYGVLLYWRWWGWSICPLFVQRQHTDLKDKRHYAPPPPRWESWLITDDNLNSFFFSCHSSKTV